MEKLFDSWMETRFLDLARLIGQRVKDLPDALSHPYGPVGYSVEEFYVTGVALAGIYNEKGGEGVAQAVSPDAYSVYKNGLGNEAGQLATARLGIDLAIIIFVSRYPYKAVASEGAVISEEAIAVKAVREAAGTASNSTTTVYRGVNSSHFDFVAQSQGVVRPNNQWWQFWKGKGSTRYQHNAVEGGTLNSPFTSWTTDLRVAENYSLRPGGTPGVIIKAEVPSSRLITSPNTKRVVLFQGGGLVSESEVSIRGTVRGSIWKP